MLRDASGYLGAEAPVRAASLNDDQAGRSLRDRSKDSRLVVGLERREIDDLCADVVLGKRASAATQRLLGSWRPSSRASASVPSRNEGCIERQSLAIVGDIFLDRADRCASVRERRPDPDRGSQPTATRRRAKARRAMTTRNPGCAPTIDSVLFGMMLRCADAGATGRPQEPSGTEAARVSGF